MFRMFDTTHRRGAWLMTMAVTAVALLGSAAVSAAQMELAIVQGTVRDDAGQPLEGATVRLKDSSRGRESETKTDKSGKFYRRGLQAVDYEITVEKAGYQPISEKVRLTAGAERRLDFKLAKAAPEGSEEFARGVDAFNKGDAQAAATAFEAALQKAPNLPEVHVNLALAYLKLSRPADAVASLEKAATLAPDQPRVLFQLGGAYVEAKQYDKAITAFEKGLAKSSDLADPMTYEATVTLGAVYFAAGKVDLAAAQFDKALAAKPGAPAPLLGLGKCAFSQGDPAKALGFFEKVVAAAPGSAEAAEAEVFIKELKK